MSYSGWSARQSRTNEESQFYGAFSQGNSFDPANIPQPSNGVGDDDDVGYDDDDQDIPGQDRSLGTDIGPQSEAEEGSGDDRKGSVSGGEDEV